MANWYDKYMTIYGKPFSEVPQIQAPQTQALRLQVLKTAAPL